MSPSRAKVGDTVRITVQGFQVGASGVSAWGSVRTHRAGGPSEAGGGAAAPHESVRLSAGILTIQSLQRSAWSALWATLQHKGFNDTTTGHLDEIKLSENQRHL